jgi:pSer/pThr/pTyr-binding forkhead associated (FHA) protein
MGGYVLSIAGLVEQWLEVSKKQPDRLTIRGLVGKAALNIASPPPIDRPPGFMASNPRLQGIRGSFSNSIVPITNHNFTIGRASDNDLQLHDTKVSRQHACLRYAQGAWYIQDRESTAGLWINDQPVQAIRLNSGDKITIGDEVFIFYL